MMNWKKEKPLIGPEGLIKGLHPVSSTDCWFIQSCNDSMADEAIEHIESTPRRNPQIDSFVQVGVPIRAIVKGLLSQGNRREI